MNDVISKLRERPYRLASETSDDMKIRRQREREEAADAYQSLANRYDDAMKRIHDLTAELEHLRREVNRG
jgi:hypothetical protein